eukprot:6202748-Amphidinium_carterae.3
MCRWARAQGVRIQVGTCARGQDATDLTDQVHSPRRVATHHRVVLLSLSARRIGPELRRSSGGSNHKSQNNSEKALGYFEEDVAGDGAKRHETAFHSRGVDESGEMLDEQEQDQQEPVEMKRPQLDALSPQGLISTLCTRTRLRG